MSIANKNDIYLHWSASRVSDLNPASEWHSQPITSLKVILTMMIFRRAKRRNMERLALACGGVAMNSVDELGNYILLQKSELVNLEIKFSSPSDADLRINLIPFRFPLMGLPCWDNFNWGIKHWFKNIQFGYRDQAYKRNSIYTKVYTSEYDCFLTVTSSFST